MKRDGACAPIISEYLESVRSREGRGSSYLTTVNANSSSGSAGTLSINGSHLQHMLVYAHEGLRISIQVLNPKAALGLRATVKLMRTDAMVIDEREIQLNGAEPRIEMVLEPLILANGFYKLCVEIRAGQAHLGRLSQQFEVQEMETEKGGWPMLIYPVTLKAETESVQ